LYSEAIGSRTLWKSEASLAYNAFYMQSRYGTPATSLSYKECDDMQKPVVNSILANMVINRKEVRAVVFGTAQYGVSNSTISQQSSSMANSYTSWGALYAMTQQGN
jgi:hypothetical protein